MRALRVRFAGAARARVDVCPGGETYGLAVFDRNMITGLAVYRRSPGEYTPQQRGAVRGECSPGVSPPSYRSGARACVAAAGKQGEQSSVKVSGRVVPAVPSSPWYRQ